MKPTQKPAYNDSRGFVAENSVKYVDKSNFNSSYYKKRWFIFFCIYKLIILFIYTLGYIKKL